MKRPLTMVTRGLAIWMVAVGVLLVGTAADASTLLFLENGNSRVDLCVSGCVNGTAGANAWTVDGVDRLYREWFWYRVDPDPVPLTNSGAQPLDWIGTPISVGGAGGSTASVTYENAAIKATVDYALSGGDPGSNSSLLQEIVTLTNKSATGSVWLNLFQYSDFDMCGFASNDTALIHTSSGEPVATQTGSCGGVVIQTYADGASRYAVQHGGGSDLTIPEIEDGYNLNNWPGGSGDVTTTFQWTSYTDSLNFATADNTGTNVKIFGVMKEVAPGVPEPMSILLLGTGLHGVGRTARRRWLVERGISQIPVRQAAR